MSDPAGRVPAWRIAAGSVVLLSLLSLAAYLTPVYYRNLKLQQYVEALASRAVTQAKPDDVVRSEILDKATELELPVKTDDIQISRLNGDFHITVRYFVRVNLPFYKVDLHFYPGAGSR